MQKRRQVITEEFQQRTYVYKKIQNGNPSVVILLAERGRRKSVAALVQAGRQAV